MSEPLSAVEIEDVLSSIRRLVSEDLRPAARGVADHAVVSGAAKPALILTPALRVVPEAGPKAMAVPIQEVVATVGAAVADQQQDWESETGDAVERAGPVWTDAVWAEPVWAEPVWAEAAWSDPEPVQAPFAHVADVSDAEVLEPDDTSDAPGWAQAGAEDVAELASPVAEPAAPVADPDWAEQAEAEVIAGLEQSAPLDGAQADPELSFDEEVLRDLVRDLIREELQGHLGERITRNIRKLVRAEIARALTAAELG